MKSDDTPSAGPSRPSTRNAPARSVDVSGALAAAGTAAWSWEQGDPAIAWTPGAADMLGVPDIILSSPELLVRATGAEDLALISNVLERAQDSGTTFSARLPIQLGTSLRWYDIAGRVLVGEPGEVLGATGTATEVTDRREAEEAILATLDEAENALRSLLAFVWRWDPTSGLLTILRQPKGVTLVPEVPEEVSVAEVVDRMGDSDGARFRDALAKSWFDAQPVALQGSIRDDDQILRRMMLRAHAASSGDLYDVVGVLTD